MKPSSSTFDQNNREFSSIPALLLDRLDKIGQSLARKEHALALIGLGSVGLELDRLDEYSDLDFFAIVDAGYKQRFIDHLDWLSDIAPIAYHFRNTDDGYKLLFQDGVFCEFAVFEPHELSTAAFAPGRVIWKRPEAPDSIGSPAHPTLPAKRKNTEWLVGEAVTNLYVGLERHRRGEKLSAERFIQHYAVDRILELTELIETVQTGCQDPFSLERRFEQRFPGTAQNFPMFIQGYQNNKASAIAILSFLETHFDVNPAIAQAIRNLAAGA